MSLSIFQIVGTRQDAIDTYYILCKHLFCILLKIKQCRNKDRNCEELRPELSGVGTSQIKTKIILM